MSELNHLLTLLIGGALVLLISWLPAVLKRAPLSLPMICVALGYGASISPFLHFSANNPGTMHSAELVSEAVMLLALMGAGLRIDRPFRWASWGTPWRLLAVAMPLTMLFVFAAARWGIGIAAPAALLLAAALAPTDPVLAGDVQTGPPGNGEDGETRFALTAEAGFNDGLAFPFILLALALQAGSLDWSEWIGLSLTAEIAIGLCVGLMLGRLFGWMMFHLPNLKLSETGDGLVAIGATFLCYAATMLLHGNGFVAVFIAALAIRSSAPEDKFHAAMAEFASQIERVLVMLVLVLFGYAIGNGLLAFLTWQSAALAIAVLVVFRPLACWIAFAGSTAPRMSKNLIGIFGIRGIGTIYYLLYAFHRGTFMEQDQLWSIAGLVILVSILVHGTVSTPLMLYADKRRKQQPATGDPAKSGVSR